MLSGVGDALGYRNQLWEYNESGPAIHQVRARQTGKEKSQTCNDKDNDPVFIILNNS